MKIENPLEWRRHVSTPETVLAKITPGMRIFIGTGVGEPRTLLQHLRESTAYNLKDLELFQLVSLGAAIALKARDSEKYRLKTFFTGWEASEAITEGLADFIPSRYYQIPGIIRSGQIPIDAAFVQITPPNDAGFCSLGVCIDAGKLAIEQASLVVGAINPWVPRTFGDTFVHISAFDLLVEAGHPPIYFDRWKPDAVYEKVAANVAATIEDGSCIGFSVGPLYEALSHHLTHKRDLGIHTPFFFDSLMDLVTCGAVTNRFQRTYPGKSLTSYAIGTSALMAWLDNNPLVEFQSIDRVFNPLHISRNPRYVAVLPARKVDLSGRIALHTGKGNVGSGPGEVVDFFNGALLSEGGRTIFALPSRNRRGEPNLLASVREVPNQFSLWEAVSMIVTEYGIVSLTGRSVRERAQALIDIAHPDDRGALVAEAKKRRIIYPDQIYLAESAHLYPAEITARHTFAGGVAVRFRAIKPSDEEEMRRLFYRFSETTVYTRYFTPLKIMPHARMPEYVNVDYSRVLSIVALVGEPGHDRVVAEARFAKQDLGDPYAEVAFVVDEDYQKIGIATFLCRMLCRLARERQLKGFTADVLAQNRSMLRVFEKIEDCALQARLVHGVYQVTLDFQAPAEAARDPEAPGYSGTI